MRIILLTDKLDAEGKDFENAFSIGFYWLLLWTIY